MCLGQRLTEILHRSVQRLGKRITDSLARQLQHLVPFVIGVVDGRMPMFGLRADYLLRCGDDGVGHRLQGRGLRFGAVPDVETSNEFVVNAIVNVD